jgi:hypothetical protein
VLKEKGSMVCTQDTLTPIQIGTSGVWNNKKFTVIGRVRCYFEDDIVNNWSIYFEDGRLLSLVEGYGHYAVYEKIPPDVKLTYSKVYRLAIGNGTVESVSGKRYVLERKNTCLRIEVEGEAWVFDWNGVFGTVEAASLEGDRVELMDLESNAYLCFRIHYQDFEAFNFQHLRPQKIGTITKTLTCTQCIKPIELRSFPLAQSFACKHCGAALSYQGGQIKYRQRLKLDKSPAIPLYVSGVIKGTEYEVVGFAEKEDAHGWAWREYTLFNPAKGYAFLSEYNGHWIFLIEKNEAPVMEQRNKGGLRFKDKEFLLFNEFHYSIKDARGEFPGDVFNDTNPQCREFICPPEIWVREYAHQGMVWYHGEHISSYEIYSAFGRDISLPYRVGVGAVQPIKGSVDLQWLKKSMLAAAIFLFLLFGLTAWFNREEVVYSDTIQLVDSLNTQTTITPKFRLDKGHGNLQIEVQSPLVNNWLETNITLVNADNAKEYSVVAGIEYYSGYEGGESWSEGSNSKQVLLTEVPAGNYFLEIIASKQDRVAIPEYSVTATYDVTMWSNFWIIFAMILVPALLLYAYILIREGARWTNSSFSSANNDYNED